jgi:hypothetical protein
MEVQSNGNASQIITMKRRMQPAMIFFLSVITLLAALAFHEAISECNTDALIIAILLITAAFGFNIPMERGYFIRYDYDTIYQRAHGYKILYLRRHPVTTMRFEDIVSMSTGFVNNTIHNRAFMNFDVILLHHKDGKTDDIFLHPASFTPEAVRDFLHFLRDRRPDIFTPEVTTFLDG